VSELTSFTARTVLAPLDDTSRSEAVTRRLAQAIRMGLILDGEQLPSESQLAGSLGVSTVTLREALAALREQGLVETRRGRRGGTFVVAPTEHLPEELADRLGGLSPQQLRDFGDVRSAIAGTAARLAAERALPAEQARLREQWAKLRDARTTGDRRRADTRLRVEIAAAAQSPRLAQQTVRLIAEVGDLLWLPGDGGGCAAVSVEDWSALLDAIRARRATKARDLAERHVAAETARLLDLRLKVAEP
jgi:DNA-binding FadR family transcriptional regulator